MKITLAKSKAGHDKNHVYVMIGEEADSVFLANGNTKTCDKPKKKKKIHIQPIKKLPEEIKQLESEQNFDDELVRTILSLYNRRKENV